MEMKISDGEWSYHVPELKMKDKLFESSEKVNVLEEFLDKKLTIQDHLDVVKRKHKGSGSSYDCG